MFAVMSDLHIDNHLYEGGKFIKGINVRCQNQLKTLYNAIQKIDKRDIKHLIIAGDLFHTHKPLPAIIAFVAKTLKYYNGEITILLGNHDYKLDASSSALEPLILLKNVKIVREVTHDNNILYIPYISDRDLFLETLKENITNHTEYVICHFGVTTKNNILNVANDFIDTDTLYNLYPNVTFISGHNHEHIIDRNCYNFGTLCPFNYSYRGLDVGWFGIFDNGFSEKINVLGERFFYEDELPAIIDDRLTVYTKKKDKKQEKEHISISNITEISYIDLIKQFIDNTIPKVLLDKKEEIIKTINEAMLKSLNLISSEHEIFKIKTIKCRNFMSYDECTLSFNDNGITIVQGNNGSGKSVLLIEMVCYALFNITMRKIPYIISWGQDKSYIEINLESKNNWLTIKKDIFLTKKNSIDYSIELISSFTKPITTKKQVQDFIRTYFGSFRQFINGNIFTRLNLDSFTAISDSERKTLIEELLNLNIFDDLYNEAKKLHDKKKYDVTNMLAKLKYAKETFSSYEEDSEKINKTILQYQNKFDELKPTSNDIRKEIADINRKIEEFNQKKSDYAEQIDNDKLKEYQIKLLTFQKIQTEHTVLLRQYKAQFSKMNLSNETNCPTCGQQIDRDLFNNMRKELTDKITFHETELKTLAVTEQEIGAHIKKLNSISDNIERLEDNIRILEKKSHELEKKYNSENNIILTKKAEIKGKIAESTKQLTEYKDKIKELKIEIDKDEETLTSLNDETILLNYYKAIYGNIGIKTYIFERVLLTMSELVNADMKEMMPEFTLHVKLNDKMSLNLFLEKTKMKEEILYNFLSDGQKRRLDFLILKAINKIAKMGLFCSNIDIMIYDEVYDVLDKEGIELINQYLQKESKELPVYIITHSDDIKDYMNYNNYIYVENNNGISHYTCT